MTLLTKSIQNKSVKNDGIRICVMRKPGKKAKYDIWMPVLAPSKSLLDNYHKKKINWEIYEKRFKTEVIKKQKKFLQLFTYMALRNKITILCWEKTPEQCHRRLIAEECMRINKKLKIIIK